MAKPRRKHPSLDMASTSPQGRDFLELCASVLGQTEFAYDAIESWKDGTHVFAFPGPAAPPSSRHPESADRRHSSWLRGLSERGWFWFDRSGPVRRPDPYVSVMDWLIWILFESPIVLGAVLFVALFILLAGVFLLLTLGELASRRERLTAAAVGALLVASHYLGFLAAASFGAARVLRSGNRRARLAVVVVAALGLAAGLAMAASPWLQRSVWRLYAAVSNAPSVRPGRAWPISTKRGTGKACRLCLSAWRSISAKSSAKTSNETGSSGIAARTLRAKAS